MDLAAVPGVAVGTVRKGKVEWTGGFGVTVAGGTTPVTADTVFEAASVSKTFTGYGALRLCDEHLLDLDRPLLDYAPYPEVQHDPRAATVTARHVLSHSSGLPNWRSPQEANRLPFAFAPGDRFSYSGEGFYWLQHVMEEITGNGFDEFMRQRVFDPLGLPTSSFCWRPEYERSGVLASAHRNRGQPVESYNQRRGHRYQPLAERWGKPLHLWKAADVARAAAELDPDKPLVPEGALFNGALSLFTTVNEYARFLTHLMPQALPSAFDLSETIRREAFRPQVRLTRHLSWGLGWGIEEDNGNTSFWQWGDNNGYMNFALGEVAGSVGVIVLTNSSTGNRLWRTTVSGATASSRGEAAMLWL
jgi:CubicO group peptidase (beta-lactamase class C family)